MSPLLLASLLLLIPDVAGIPALTDIPAIAGTVSKIPYVAGIPAAMYISVFLFSLLLRCCHLSMFWLLLGPCMGFLMLRVSLTKLSPLSCFWHSSFFGLPNVSGIYMLLASLLFLMPLMLLAPLLLKGVPAVAEIPSVPRVR
jgi:hypothetical protein